MTPVPGPWAARTDGRRYLSSARQIVASVGEYLGCRRFTSLQQTRLVSLDADHSRRSQNAPFDTKDSTIGAVSFQPSAISIFVSKGDQYHPRNGFTTRRSEERFSRN